VSCLGNSLNFSQKIDDGIIKAIDVIKQIMEGWEEIPSLEK